MEWLDSKVVTTLIALLSGWFWYDKKSRDTRFKVLEDRMSDIESLSSKQQTQLEVMNTELMAFSKLTDVRLGHIQDGLDKVVTLIEKQNEAHNG